MSQCDGMRNLAKDIRQANTAGNQVLLGKNAGEEPCSYCRDIRWSPLVRSGHPRRESWWNGIAYIFINTICLFALVEVGHACIVQYFNTFPG
jgi:hypothetical protein